MMKDIKSISMINRIVSFIIAFSMIISACAFMVSAEEAWLAGTVTDNSVNVRSGPGTGYSKLKYSSGSIVQLNMGNSIMAEDKNYPTEDGQNYFWYHVKFTLSGESFDGYVCSEYVNVIRPAPQQPEENKEFEAQLSKFPDTYKPYLIALHSLHPSWSFLAFDTGLDWNYLQGEQNVIGKSLTDSKIISYRSVEAGCYDWFSDTFFLRESTVWYQASPLLVAYYTDPRNFLNESSIFQFEKLSFSASSQTVDGIQSMLAGTFMENGTTVNLNGESISYAQAFFDAASQKQVSAYHLVSRCIQEVGKSGTAPGSRGDYPGYEGYYNFFNIAAYTGGEDGLKYAKNNGWDTQYKSILGGAEQIAKNYISVGQDTLYYQKFNVVNRLFHHQYMSNIAAPYNEGVRMKNNYNNLGLIDLPFVFSIPIYHSMPQSASPIPEAKGNPNNILSSLSVDGYENQLTPSFDKYKIDAASQVYNLIIKEPVSSVNISASKVSSHSTVTGAGKVDLKHGENMIVVNCISESGNAREYYIRIVLENSQEHIDPSPGGAEITSGYSTNYFISGNTVSTIPLGTTVQNFISGIKLEGETTASVIHPNGYAVSDGVMCSGYILRIKLFNTAPTNDYTAIIYGDGNGDGAIDGIDVVNAVKIILNAAQYKPFTYLACDVNRDGVVDGIDVTKLCKHILGVNPIIQ